MSKDMANIAANSRMRTKLQAIELMLRECHTELANEYKDDSYIESAMHNMDTAADYVSDVLVDLRDFQARKEGE